MRKLAVVAAGAVALASFAAVLPSNAATKAKGVRFGTPVKVTPDNGYGYEPTIVSDRYGNLYSTAHKENWQLAIAPDERSTQQFRNMSWAWWSSDFGKTWKNLPTGPADIYSHNVAVEGDMAIDSSGNVYFADMNAHDVTITAWKAAGRGELSFLHHNPIAAFAEPLDDRPWITAHGNGHVYYIGNMGNKQWYPGGRPPLSGDGSAANGPGRYTVYKSTDHGKTWDHLGFTLADSGWCRPQADLRSSYVYVLCGNDEGTLYSFVSADRGKTWKRYKMGTYNEASVDTYPTLEVAKDGSIWALHVSRNPQEPDEELLRLYHSRNRGKTWKVQNITPKRGRFVYTWLDVSDDGKKLGMAAYYRAAAGQPWKVYGAVWTPGKKPVLTSIDDKKPVAEASAVNPPGDYLMSAFTPDGHLNVVWTRVVQRVAGNSIYRDIYFARTR